MKKNIESIFGLQINLTLDMVLFTDPPISNQEDIAKLKENVGKMEHDIKRMLEETYHRNSWDDTICTTNMVNYITEENVSDYVQGDIYIIED